MAAKPSVPITAQYIRSLRITESKEEKKLPAQVPPTEYLEVSEDDFPAPPPDALSPPLAQLSALPLVKMPMSGCFPGTSGRQIQLTVGSYIQMSSGGTGRVNAVLANSVVGSTVDFVAVATVFKEFFIHSMTIKWQPVSRYNGPLAYNTATGLSSVPLTVTSLQHAAPAYTTVQAACNNAHLLFANTADPFTYQWKNIENPRSKVVVSPTIASVPTQSWCLSDSSSSAGYTGQIQFLSDTTATGLPGSAVLGAFAVQWLISFRNQI